MKPYLGNLTGRRLQSQWSDLKLTGCLACHSAVSVHDATPQVTRFNGVPAEDDQRRSVDSRRSFGSNASSDSSASEQGKLSRGAARVDLRVHHT